MRPRTGPNPAARPCDDDPTGQAIWDRLADRYHMAFVVRLCRSGYEVAWNRGPSIPTVENELEKAGLANEVYRLSRDCVGQDGTISLSLLG